MTLPVSGIYKITNLLNGKVYVGQSQNVFERKIQHFTALRNGNHENREMQKDWNKNNRGFRWDVIEFCPIVTPFFMQAFAPIQTLSSIVIEDGGEVLTKHILTRQITRSNPSGYSNTTTELISNPRGTTKQYGGKKYNSYIRDVNETFSEAGHETHNMR